MNSNTEKLREYRVRRKLARKGYGLVKSRSRRPDSPVLGLFQVYDFATRMAMTCGVNAYSETLEEIEALEKELTRSSALVKESSGA